MTTASQAKSARGTAKIGRRLRIAATLAMLGTLQVLPAHAMAAPGAQVFDRVDQPEQVDPQWRNGLCALLPRPCKPDTLSLYTPRDAAAGDYVVLAEQPLAMARLRRAGTAWQVVWTHDFTGYRHSMADAPKDSDAVFSPPTGLRLAPALYPVGPGRWAAAILWTATASYSGGGAESSTADFVAVDPPAGGSRVAHAGIPFSCSSTIRACFTQKEYAQSPHCQEETSGSLRIGYQESTANDGNAVAAADYRWRFTWTESTWPANQPASSTRRTTLRFAERNADTASFCGGR